MPEVLKLFLETLHEDEVDLVWDYLDGDPEAVFDMIDVLLASHGRGES